eukprot:TRINITY_DN9729_c0_g1_i1.p1 TRINITY_DN9729_c0_g1~~TRINITY_DN9729_c0_g1_i1.p1  ORF type:complete len:208 (-),score=40.48 TRINITY_DN9729_c0_g1_i1:428-1051(-)
MSRQRASSVIFEENVDVSSLGKTEESPGSNETVASFDGEKEIEIMKKGKKITKPKKNKRANYSKINNQLRNKYIHLVESRRLNMRQVSFFLNEVTSSFSLQAALFLGINYSTGKSIMNVYREDGRSRRKNKCRKSASKKVTKPTPKDEAFQEYNDEEIELKPKQKLIEYDLSSIGGDELPYFEELRLGFTYEEIEKLLTIEASDRGF